MGQHAKHLPETVNDLVQQRRDGLGRAVPTGNAGATGGENNLAIRLRDPTRDYCSNLIHIVGHDLFVYPVMSRPFQSVHQESARFVCCFRSRVGDCQDRNPQGKELSFVFLSQSRPPFVYAHVQRSNHLGSHINTTGLGRQVGASKSSWEPQARNPCGAEGEEKRDNRRGLKC